MASTPKTEYAKSGNLHIAYQVSGTGPLDLVFVPGFVSHLECQWEHPWPARFLERLGSFSRLIRFDKRGTGLSDHPQGRTRRVAPLRGCRRNLMTRFLLPVLALLLSGCVAHTRMAATDGAALADESADAKGCASIRSALLARYPGVLSVLTIFCRNQLVVIAGALPPDYKPAVEAVHIAAKTPGVRRVETVFVPKAAQAASDAAVAARIKAALAGDANTRAPGTDLTVVAGTVVLVGMVDDQARADRIIASAASVEGVRSVRSFIQLRP